MGVLAVKRELIFATLTLAAMCSATIARADRPTDPNSTEMYHYDATDVVEHFDSPRFRVFFTRAGKNAVPTDDVDGDGIPDHVADVSALYEEVWDFHAGLGFRAPLSDENNPGDHGGDGRFDVYLLDFAQSSDGAFRREVCDAQNHCSGFIAQENDFAGYGYPSLEYADRVLSSHELFHAFQSSYDDSETTIFVEGTAVWATEQFDNTLSDFEGFVGGYLSKPDHSLYLPIPGPVDSFSYGAAIFWEYLSEKFGTAIIRELWEQSEGTPDWFSVLPSVLMTHQSNYADAFFEFATWNLHTGVRADPTQSYARGKGYPLVRIDPLTLPAQAADERLFPSSTNYLGIDPADRTSVTITLANPTMIDLSSVRFAAVTLTGKVVSAPTLADASLTITMNATGVDEIIVYLVNTARSGESVNPGLCAGMDAEVSACLAVLAPTITKPIDPIVIHHGCSALPAASTSLATLFLVAAALVLARRKQRYV